MRFYSGFGFWNERELFKEYIDDNEFCVAGFSYGAQKALIDAVHTKKRVDKLQLFSPAFFKLNPKFVKLQLNSFKKDKDSYIQKFIENVKYPKDIDLTKYIDEVEFEDLEEMFNFNWGLIEHLKGVKVEIFIGENDKIIDVKGAVKFFKNYGNLYFLKDKGHLL
jgi:predicted esterase